MTATPNHEGARHGAQSYDLRVLFTVEEAAHALGIGRTRMFELIHIGAVETVLIGRLRRVPVDALHAFIADPRMSPDATAAKLPAPRGHDEA